MHSFLPPLVATCKPSPLSYPHHGLLLLGVGQEAALAKELVHAGKAGHYLFIAHVLLTLGIQACWWLFTLLAARVVAVVVVIMGEHHLRRPVGE